MNHVRTFRATALGLGLALVLTACGQKPGVHVEGGTGGGGAPLAGEQTDDGFGDGATGEGFADADGDGFDDATGEAAVGGDAGAVEDPATDPGATTGDPGDGDADGTGDPQGGDAGGGGGGDATGGSGGGGGGDGDGGDGAGTGGGGQREVTGSDRTGVTDDAITLAVHAPVTGAAPLPSTSFEKARDMYWRWVTEAQGGDVLGRKKVNVLFKDDKYDPNSARQACRELEAKAFLLVGGGGTDQIQACGQFAQVAKAPYFSAGVTEQGLGDNPWYFASSMTYRQQGMLLARYVAKNFGGKKVAAVLTDTPNFDDAVEGWDQGRQQANLGNYYKTLRHPKGDTSWYSAFAQDLKAAGVEVVYINTSPVDYIRFTQQANQQGFNPQYVGVGVTMGLNAVLQSGCDSVDGGIFFSPFPGLDVVDKLDPDFNKAAAKFGLPKDDLSLALWGTARQQHELFKRYGSTFGDDLTREDFRALVETQSSVKSPIFPEVGFSPQNHFGGKQVHVLQADCSTETHKTLATFASNF